MKSHAEIVSEASENTKARMLNDLPVLNAGKDSSTDCVVSGSVNDSDRKVPGFETFPPQPPTTVTTPIEKPTPEEIAFVAHSVETIAPKALPVTIPPPPVAAESATAAGSGAVVKSEDGTNSPTEYAL